VSDGRAGVTAGGRLPSTLVAGLGRLARPESAAPGEIESCDLCGSRLVDDHRHMLELEERSILCACEPCIAMKAGMGHYRVVGSRVLWLDDFDCSEELWSAFQLPINLAFFFHSSSAGKVIALYPSPAGATESELHLESWQALCEANPVLSDLTPDAEALVVNRMSDEHQHAVVPIDECYRLVGLIKSTWTGISGGTAIQDAVPGFFAHVYRRAVQYERRGA
jgi:hypothetical protein